MKDQEKEEFRVEWSAACDAHEWFQATFLESLLPWCVFLKLSLWGLLDSCFFLRVFFSWPCFPALAFSFIAPCTIPLLYMLNDSTGGGPGLL